jgi:hypothetical protein
MRRAEVVDSPDQVHAMLQRAGLPGQRPAPSCERRAPLAERRIEALDRGRVDHTVALRSVPYLLNLGGRTLYDAALDSDHTPLRLAFDALCDEDTFPGA